jgi:hypothetical protein
LARRPHAARLARRPLDVRVPRRYRVVLATVLGLRPVPRWPRWDRRLVPLPLPHRSARPSVPRRYCTTRACGRVGGERRRAPEPRLALPHHCGPRLTAEGFYCSRACHGTGAAARPALAALGLGAVRRCRCHTGVLGRPLARRYRPVLATVGAAARSALAALVLGAERRPYPAVVASALPRYWGRCPFTLAALELRRRAPSAATPRC